VVAEIRYKSQVADVDELRQLHMAISCTSRKQVLITGDINFPKLNLETNESDAADDEFRDLIMDTSHVQHVKSPTRENNILDRALT
jgi:hypothetical protein